MPASFLHGVETFELLVGPRPIRQVKSAVIGLVGTAPIHHVAVDDRAAINEPELVLSDRDNAKFGPDLDTYSIPAALKAIQDQGAGTVFVINVFDPASHKTIVAAASKDITDGEVDLAVTDLISVTVTKADDTPCVDGTDYTVDLVTGIITVLSTGNLSAAATCKVGYTRANPSAVNAAAIIGGTTNGVRTGLDALRDAAAKFGYGPKIIIAPGFASDAGVQAAMDVIAQKTKLRAIALVDAPVGASRDEVITARGDSDPIDLTVSDERVYICYPHLKVSDGNGGTKLQPYSQRFAGLIAATDLDSGYWVSPSNKTIRGALGLETPLTAVINDPTCDVNALNEAGVGTVFSGFGLGLRSWGNRTSGFPGSSDITTFMCVRRTLDLVDESVELATLRYIDGPIGDVLIKAVLGDVNEFIRTLVTRGALMPGSRIEYFDEDNPPSELAQGHITFTKTACPPPPAERITYKSLVDVTLLKRS